MRAAWSTVIAPLLEAYRPGTTVALGGGGDDDFAAMLEKASEEQGFALDMGSQQFPELATPDLAIVHGEPNWFSVTERLERIAAMAEAGQTCFPVTLVEGVDWPTGRRDAYPDPAAVPIAARQAHSEDRGVERAVDSHDQRNGVMTAVEDFLAARREKIELVHVPGLGGVAILVSEQRLKGKGSRGLLKAIKDLRLSPLALEHVAAIDATRAQAEARIDELSDELETARGGLAVQSSAELEALRERIEELSARQAELREALARRDARLAALGADPRPEAPAALARLASDAPGAFEDDDQSKPSLVDRRQILLGEDDEPEAGRESIDVVIRMSGDPERLRACIWSLLARADRPLRLTLLTDGESNEEGREIAEAMAAAEPKVRVEDREPQEGTGEWTLRVDAALEFAHGTIRNLVAAAENGGSPRTTAAVSSNAIGVPHWAGRDSLALLLSGEAREIAVADGAASACVALPPGATSGEPAAVALDAVVEDGARGRDVPAGLDWLDAAFRDEPSLATYTRKRLDGPLSVAYVLPGLPAEGSGGSHSVFQEALALRSLGVRARVLVEGEFADRAAGLYPEAADQIHPYGSPRAFANGLAGFDVAVATEAPSARLVVEYVRANDGVVGAYYVQDYEPLFSPQGGPSSDAALLSYRHAEGLLLFAKTHWIANVVAAAHRIPVAKVSPSLDQTAFHAEGRRTESTPIRVLAMIRPRTPRRRPAETRSALARIKRELGDRVECLSFGCEMEELEALPAADGIDHLGVLARTDVAEVLRRCDVFLDLSSYQAFGRTGLEAMACGAVPVLPAVGGVSEYAVADQNALFVDTSDEDAVVDAASALARDPARLERMRACGIESARSFTVTRAAISQYACFDARFQAMKEAR